MSSSAAAGRPGDHHRFVVLVDMDCFYCQVEEKLQPELCGQPVAVVQYTEWNGGGAIIAVNYAARAAGVTRHMRSAEATQTCPNIRLVLVPSAHGKADLGRYREAGKEVAAVLQTFTPLVERASVDEAYMDITRNVRERCQQMGRVICPLICRAYSGHSIHCLCTTPANGWPSFRVHRAISS